MQPKVLIVDGLEIINIKRVDYEAKRIEYEIECQRIRSQFIRKVSRVQINDAGDIREYPNWYRKNDNGYLTAAGKTEPDYNQYYPPKPKEPNIPKYEKGPTGPDGFTKHILISFEDFNKFSKLFKKNWVFAVTARM